MFLPQSGLLGFTRNINAIPVPNQVTSKTAFVPFTDAGNDWQGRYYPIKMADGNWVAVWLEGTFHSDYNSATHTVNIHFSNDEGVTWTDNNEYFGSVPVTGFPLIPPGGTATGFVDFCLTLCPNGDIILIAQNRGSNPTVWNAVNFSQHQYRSTDNGATWAYEFDFCDAIGENTVALRAKIQGLFETMIIGDDLYVILCQIRTDLDDTRIQIYKTSDNGATWSFLSNPIEYDEVDPDCTESALAHLGNGRIICVFRTQDLGQALWKTSNDYGATWGSVTEFSEQLGYVGLHQPRIKAYSNFFLCMGRDNKKIVNNPDAAFYQRNSWWTTTDLFASPCPRYYLDPYYTGDGTASNGDAGYTRAVQKNDGSFMFFGYYGLNSASLIYKYDVSHTNSPSTEHYSNTNFFPDTLSTSGFRFQGNRDNIFASPSSPVLGGLAIATRHHNTLLTGDVQWIGSGNTNATEFVVVNDKGWIIFNASRIIPTTSIGNTLFRNSFSIGMWLMPDDGQPAATQIIFSDRSIASATTDATTDRVQISLGSTGIIAAGYMINNTAVTATTAAAVFANGAITTPVHLAVTFTSGGLIRLYINGVETITADMSALTMASYTTTRLSTFGQRENGAGTYDLSYLGKMREIMCQPVVWSAGDIANIMLN
jgi:hypothetical protein